jgi:hypothetical protein
VRFLERGGLQKAPWIISFTRSNSSRSGRLLPVSLDLK